MDSPFYWNMPSRPRYYSPVAARGTPVQRQQPTVAERAAPKVVSIPVQFVRSERSIADSAVKIQKVFRGFLARKGVKKVLALRKEVAEIEKRIRDEEVAELIRRPESKERVKLIEGLMNLLFRLDSVRGVVPGVRDCRKATIKKAIALQEAIDAIVAGKAVGGDGGKRVDEDPTLEMKDGAPEVKDSSCNDISGSCNSSGNAVTDTDELQAHIDRAIPESGKGEEAEAISPPNSNESGDGEIQETIEEEEGKLELTKEGEIDENSNPSLMGKSLKGNECTSQSGSQSAEENAIKMNQESELEGENHATEDSKVIERDEKNRRDRDVLQRMVEDNERMMGLMEKLVEKNEEQTRLLNSLSQRVETLERALVCQKLRKSRKKRHAYP